MGEVQCRLDGGAEPWLSMILLFLPSLFPHGKAKGTQAVVMATTSRTQRRIVAATPRPFHVSKLFELSPPLPRKIDMQPAAAAAASPRLLSLLPVACAVSGLVS